MSEFLCFQATNNKHSTVYIFPVSLSICLLAGWFHNLATITSMAMNMGMRSHYKFFQIICTETELLDHIINSATFGGSSVLLFKCLELLYVITSLVKSSIFFSHSHQHSDCILLGGSAGNPGYRACYTWDLPLSYISSPAFSGFAVVVVFIMHIITGFWMTIFVSFWWPFICFLERNVYSSPCPLKKIWL